MAMKSKVYFIETQTHESLKNIKEKIDGLIETSKILKGTISANDSVAVKLHFGEEGNTGYVQPAYVRLIVDNIRGLKAKPFLVDSNTLYKGRRTNSKEHLQIAAEHGFSRENIGVEVVIADETKAGSIAEIALDGEFIKTAKIMRVFVEADAVVGIAHFKGHIMTGFGGALKNIGMGTASRRGKLEQHASISPIVIAKKCIGCSECIKQCPVDAITLENEKAQILGVSCIGCAGCIAVCPESAIDVAWKQGAASISQKMAEYAKAALMNKKGKGAYINFAIKITKECDCLAKDDPRVVDDIGLFASVDPVAVDKACVDAVNRKAGKELFMELHPERDWRQQLLHAEKIGLGTLDYELIKV
jgi:uncharacterized Fe-S center protein